MTSKVVALLRTLQTTPLQTSLWQYATTHCNTTSLCNTLLFTATHGDTRRHTATLCNTLQHTAVLGAPSSKLRQCAVAKLRSTLFLHGYPYKAVSQLMDRAAAQCDAGFITLQVCGWGGVGGACLVCAVVCCGVMQCAAECCSVKQCVTVCCLVL